MHQLIAILLYFCFVLTVGILSYRKQTTSSAFLSGDRSLNYWLTALAAHASDMGNWLFMGYPSMIFLGGIFQAWVGLGLIFCMLLNWQWLAPKIRIATEQFNCFTLSSYLENRFQDKTGLIRSFSALLSFIFYSIYIAAGLAGLGLLGESLFGISFESSIIIGIGIVVTYVFIGGYVTLAWLDLFQGFFLLFVILIVPFYLIPQFGGMSSLYQNLQAKELSTSLLPNFSPRTLLTIISLSLGWGLGYFGQPHIITKFMGIKHPSEIHKSKWVGMSWMTLSLFAATLVGVLGVTFFQSGIYNPEMIFIEMVKQSFHPFIIGLSLAAIIAAIVNVMSSQMLVLSSILSEDFYKRIFRKTISEKKLLIFSRFGILGVAFLAFIIAYGRFSSIYSLVLFAWSGLGASFGPLLLYSLYSKRANKFGAWVGMLSGGITVLLWPYCDGILPVKLDPILPAFLMSFLLNWGVCQIVYVRSKALDIA